MKRMTRIANVATLLLSLLIAWPAASQIAGQDMPDMSALQQVFGAINKGEERTEVIKDENGLIGSGVLVPETGNRGNMAKAISGMLAEISKKPEIAEPLEEAFAQAMVKVEEKLPELGFQPRDYGVAFAYFFITTWQIANEAENDLSEDVIKQTGQKLVQVIQASFADTSNRISDEDLEKQYDMFLTLPTSIAVIIESFKQQDQNDFAASMREMAGQSFEQIIGISPYDIDITEEGIKGWK